MSSPLKLLTVLGARSEFIRMSRVIAQLDQHARHVLVYTGQKSGDELDDAFFCDVARRPDHFLHVDRSTPGTILGDVLVKTETVLDVERPAAVLVTGDKHSAYAAIIARQMGIPVYHLENGSQSFDSEPEDVNGRLIDHASDYNLVYTEHGRRKLLAEGVHPQRIHAVGTPMREVLDHHCAGIAASNVLDRMQLVRGEYFVVCIRRAENTGAARRLLQLHETLSRLRREYGLPVLVSTHPEARQRLEELHFDFDERVEFLPPLAYHDQLRLQSSAICTLSDGGLTGEEASVLGFPAVTVHGFDPEIVLPSIRAIIADGRQQHEPIADRNCIHNTSTRVARLILDTTTRSGAANVRVAAPLAA